MNIKISTSIKCTILTLIVTLLGIQATLAATFTAVASGNWSSSVTWGGQAPGNTISNGDFIVIPFGITVNLDNSVEFNNALSTLSVSGSLTSSTNSNLTINSGTLSGNGNINTNNFTVGTTAFILFSGDINTNNFTSNHTLLNLSSNINVSNTLFVNGGVLQLNGGSSFNLGANGNINLSNGSLGLNGGVFTNVGLYNVNYSGGSASLGTWLMTSSLNNLTLSLDDNDDQLDLNGNLFLMGNLTLNSGQLNLDGSDLVVNGQVISSANGSIYSSATSSIAINASGDAGSINFATGGNVVNNFVLDSQGSNGLNLGSSLTVNGMLELTDGNFNIQGSNTLVLNGTFSNNNGNGGSIGVGSQSNLVLNGSGDWTSLSLEGSDIDNFTINLSGDGQASLHSNLHVHGTLAINNGTLLLNGQNLTLSGTLSGQGNITGNNSSSLSFTGTGNSMLNLSPNSQSLNDLTVNLSGNGSVTLGSNLIVGGQYQQQSGSLVLNGFNLSLNGTSSYTGGGITGHLSSNVFVNGSGNVGTIGFANGGNMLNDFMVNLTNSGWVSLNSDLHVHGTLWLTNGNVNTNGNNLVINTTGHIVGGGSNSYVIGGNGGQLMLNLGTSVSDTFYVGTTSNYNPVVITNNSSTSGNFGVGSQLGVFANGTSGMDMTTVSSMVNTGWDITSDITTGLNANIELFWQSGMGVNGFNSTQASVAHYTNGNWDVNSFGNATVHGNGMLSIAGTGYTSLSPFAVFDANTVTSVKEQPTATAPVISVFPNPTANTVNINVTEPTKYKRVRLVNMIGAEMASVPVTATLTQLDMSTMPAGVYFLSIDGVFTQRIVKR